MATEQGLYAQVVVILRKDPDKKGQVKDQNNSRGNPQDQYANLILIMSR